MKEEGQEPDESMKLERWNHPRINIYRYLRTLLCFINMGMDDAAYGVSAKVRKYQCPANI
jgi:hypothetical protein